jgi:hypothetical protein
LQPKESHREAGLPNRDATEAGEFRCSSSHRVEGDDDLPVRAPLLDVSQRLKCLVERERRVDDPPRTTIEKALAPSKIRLR